MQFDGYVGSLPPLLIASWFSVSVAAYVMLRYTICGLIDIIPRKLFVPSEFIEIFDAFSLCPTLQSMACSLGDWGRLVSVSYQSVAWLSPVILTRKVLFI